MLLAHYIILPLKQLLRLKTAFFFTLIFPVLLYLIYGRNTQIAAAITFFNFSMQSSMLLSVGMFAAAHRTTAWGEYLRTLPAPFYFAVLGIVIAMLMVGVMGILLIGLLDHLFIHTFSYKTFILALLGALLGSIPAGTLGYCLGITLDVMAARNALILCNIACLFATLLPDSFHSLLAYFLLPNTWLDFSRALTLHQHIKLYDLLILAVYCIVFLLLIGWQLQPRQYYQAR